MDVANRSARRDFLLSIVCTVVVTASCSGREASLPAAPPSIAPSAPAPTPIRAVAVDLKDFVIGVGRQGPSGVVSFKVNNRGSVNHEFDIYQSALPLEGLPIDGGTGEVDEASVKVDTVARSPSIAPGGSATVETTLTPGRYNFVCNQPGHYKQGMRFEYTVQ